MVAGIPPVNLLEFKALHNIEWGCFRAYTRKRIDRNHIHTVKTQQFRFKKHIEHKNSSVD